MARVEIVEENPVASSNIVVHAFPVLLLASQVLVISTGNSRACTGDAVTKRTPMRVKDFMAIHIPGL